MPAIVPEFLTDDSGYPIPIYQPFTTARNKHQKAIDESGEKERKLRRQDIAKRRKYYDGEHVLPLEVEKPERDHNIIINVYGGAVDRIVKFCRVPDIEVEDGFEKVTSDTGVLVRKPNQIQEALDVLLKESEVADLVPNTLESGSLAGHSYYRIVMPEDGEPTVDNPPHLEMIDPEYMTVFWHGGSRRLLWYRMTWSFGDDVMRQDVVPVSMATDDLLSYAQNATTVREDGWLIVEQKKKNRSAGYEVVAVDVWDYPFPPIVDGKLTRRSVGYYGRPLIKGYRSQDALNFVASNTGKIVYVHAHPKTLLFGDQLGDQVDFRIDGIIDGLDAEARAQQLEMISDLSSSINFYNLIRESFFNEVGMTDPSAVKDKIGAATNFVMRMLFGDQVETATEIRRQQTKLLCEGFRRLLYIIGFEDAAVIAKWPNPLPANREEDLKNAETEDRMKITSKTTLAEELGRDYPSELAQIEAETQREADLLAMTRRIMADRGVFDMTGAAL